MYPHLCEVIIENVVHSDCYLLRTAQDSISLDGQPIILSVGLVYVPALAKIYPIQIELINILDKTEFERKLKEYADK